MKKASYISPKIELVQLNNEDVITTSLTGIAAGPGQEIDFNDFLAGR